MGDLDPATLAALAAEAADWRTQQDGQRILTNTPTVLGGCRAQVYRVAGATQWYTAVIVGINEHTGVSISLWCSNWELNCCSECGALRIGALYITTKME